MDQLEEEEEESSRLMPRYSDTLSASRASPYRLRRVCVSGPVHDGDVDQNVRPWAAHLLRILVQPVRLCCN